MATLKKARSLVDKVRQLYPAIGWKVCEDRDRFCQAYYVSNIGGDIVIFVTEAVTRYTNDGWHRYNNHDLEHNLRLAMELETDDAILLSHMRKNI